MPRSHTVVTTDPKGLSRSLERNGWKRVSESSWVDRLNETAEIVLSILGWVLAFVVIGIFVAFAMLEMAQSFTGSILIDSKSVALVLMTTVIMGLCLTLGYFMGKRA